ncbi:Bug family tripartite tricarboxylate transporter substrate binding protein [Verminephrobacter eiseniae]|uniref:Bug family tripartite tricarboxylate transporter substrate binding protein n=2 Tax=Verminephrobacter eiseniae TaxID=364317 RepID=UPI00224370B9|nr:tripartite tricarboxylate transporter substrate binding protein [Verminephrobacter eiseniae]
MMNRFTNCAPSSSVASEICTASPLSRRALLLAAVGCVPALAGAQGREFPQRPIRLVLGFPPGGATDNSARLVAQKMAEGLGQPIVVENRPGASGNIAAEAVARSAPDGYTLFYTTSTIHGINPNVFAKLPYDPVADFEPVLFVSRTLMVLLVRSDLGVTSTRELIQLAKSKPGKLTYASAGLGSTQHLAGALFCSKTGVDALHVPYKGSSQALTDLMSGQVDFMIDTLSASLSFIRGGKLRGLATSGLERSPVLPDLPTIDAGGVPGYNVAAWGGFLVPKGTPASIIRALNAAGNQAIRSQEVASRAAATGSELKGGTPNEFGDFIRHELATWKLAVAAAGVPKQ